MFRQRHQSGGSIFQNSVITLLGSSERGLFEIGIRVYSSVESTEIIMTKELFREDSYLKCCDAVVTAVDADSLVLDQTVFYPTGGGQPGDVGSLTLESGETIKIIDTRKGENDILHVCAPGTALPAVGTRVRAKIDWERRTTD